MLGAIKKFFSKNNNRDTIQEVLTAIDTEEEEGIVEKDPQFQNQYLSAKQINTLEDYKKFIIDLVMEKMTKTSYAPYKDFLYEIKYFLHYTFLVIEDDFKKGDKIFQKRITQLDNYIFSSYRKKPSLQKNIKKLCALAYSKRFVDPPKENILSYFVFMEENGIEIIEILEDFSFVLKNDGKVPDWIFNPKEKTVKKSYEKNIDAEQTVNLQTLNSIYSNLENKTRVPKVDITENHLS